MKRSRILLLALLSLMFSTELWAQQESQYTQYMYNPLLVNPGYAGSRGVPSIFGLYRNQWLGIEGAPKTSTLSFHMPFENKQVGLGLSIHHESIGPQTTNNLMVDFSYSLDFDNGAKLALGLKGSAGLYNFDRNKLRLYDISDTWFNYEKDNVFSPNVGVGAYWYTDTYYFGLSVPNLLSSKVFSREKTTISTVNSVQHYYILGGYVFDLSDSVKFKPAVLSKIAKGSPLQLDLSANFMFNEKFVLGAAYRWSAAVSAMAGFQINKSWFIGYAYDWETTDLAKYNSGSHEIFLRYEFMRKIGRIVSPRFF